jgi:hypothetical protein
MKTSVEYVPQTFSILEGGDWLASLSGRFISGGCALSTYRILGAQSICRLCRRDETRNAGNETRTVKSKARLYIN